MTVSWALILPVGQESSPERRYLSGPEGKVAFLGPEQVVGKSLYPEEAWKEGCAEGAPGPLPWVPRSGWEGGQDMHHMLLGFKT